MSYWEDVVKDFFVGHATFKFTLWKDNQRMEAKPFGTFPSSGLWHIHN